jgi:membrane AbrB-like protein
VPSLLRSSRLAQIVLTLAVGAIAAVLGQALHAPLPWMIGPLIATALGCIAGAPFAAAPPLRNAGQWAIGTALGLYFTPQVVGIVWSLGWAIVAGIVWALLLGAGFAAFLKWANPRNAALDRPTLFFASAIGGASEMAVLAERHGGRLDLVASAHSLRLLIVVIVVPFGFQFAGLHGLDPTLPGPQQVRLAGLLGLVVLTLAGAAAMLRLRIANAWVLGPLAVAFALTANGIELSAMPKWMVNGGQLFIGVALGSRFTPAFLHSAPRWLASVAVGTLVMIVLSAIYALVISRLSGLHPATVLLGTSPGGIAEMCITAKVLELGVPVVTAFHVTRMAAVVLLAGPMFRWAPAGR